MPPTYYKAVASGPIQFTTTGGVQLSIPASLLRFDEDGVLLEPEPPFDVAMEWLEHLVTTGFIQQEPPRATPGPSSTPVLTLTAASPGEWGNNITATINYDPVVSGHDPTYTVTVAASVSFALNTTTMATILGTEETAPTQNSPAFVVSSLVKGSTPKNTTAPLELVAGGCTIDKFGTSVAAFTLKPRRAPPGNPILVSILGAVAGNPNFTLKLDWTATSTSLGFDVADLTARQNSLTTAIGYLVDVVYNGGKPKAGPFALTGGTEGTRARLSTQAVL